MFSFAERCCVRRIELEAMLRGWQCIMKATDNTRGNELMADEQATRLKSLSEQAFEPEAFKRNLDGAEAAYRIAALQAKLRLMDGPPHTL
jgi:Protein of unknown function (DUF3072)